MKISFINSRRKIRQPFRSASAVDFSLPFFCSLLFIFCFTTASTIFAQETRPENQKEVPPPLKVLSKEEKAALEGQIEIKKRTVLTLDLMEMRLVKAESFKTKEEYRQMFDELGGFHALMDNTLKFLNRNNVNSGKVLNNFKRVELSLRKYITRLELIRRDLPPEYEPYVRRLVRYTREARTEAVEPLFGGTVLPGNKNEK